MTIFTTKRDLTQHVEGLLGSMGTPEMAESVADNLWRRNATWTDENLPDVAELAVELGVA